MPTIGVAEILVSPVFKDLQKKVGRELDGVGESAGDSAGKGFASRMTGAISGFMSGTLKAAGIAGGLTVGGAFGVALAKGFGRLQAIENAKAKLTGLGNSAADVAQIMQDAMGAVKGTAYGLDEAATVAAAAVASGVKPGAELNSVLTTVADTATIAGRSMTDVGTIFGSVAAKGKLQGDDMLQLMSSGVPVLQFLAKHYGITSQAASDMVSAGKVDFANFAAAMKEGLGGAAQASGQTLQGAFKNTMAAVGRIGANLLSGVYPKIQQFFANAINWLQPLEEGAKVAGAAIGDFLSRAVDGAQGLYDLLVKGDFTGKLTAAFGWEEDSPLVDFLLRVRDGAKGLYDLLAKGDYTGMLQRAFGWEEDSKVVDFLLGVRDAVIGITSGLTMDAATREQFSGQLEGWVKAGAEIRTAFEKAPGVLGDAVKKIWEFREPIGVIAGLILLSLIPHWVALGVEALKSAAMQKIAWGVARAESIKAAFAHSWAVTTMVGGWIALGVAALASGAETAAIWLMYQWDSVKAIASMVAARTAIVASWVVMGAQALLNGARIAAGWLLAMGPVGWAIGIIGLIIGAFIAAYNNIGWFKDGVDTALRAVGDFFAALWNDWIKPVFEWIADAARVVVEAFQWLFTDGVKYATDGIGAALNWVYESIIKPVFDGISAAVKFVGDVFTAFYESTLKPVFDSAAVIIGGFYLFFRGVGQLIVSIIQNIVIPLFLVFWQRVVDSFNGIMTAIGDWWNGVVGIFNDVVMFIQTTLSAVFTWLLESVVRPVFDALGTAIRWVWDNVVKPTFDAWVWFFTVVIPDALNWLYANVILPVFTAIGDAVNWVWLNVLKPTLDAWVNFFTVVIPGALNWLYANVVQPVFTAIGNAVNWVWSNLLKPVLDGIVNFFTVVIPNAANWLYTNGIKPVFDSIGSTIKWTWENVIKPVFDTLSDFIQKSIPDAFTKGVDFIKTAWDRIQDIAKAPVRFVIDTVINDGLIGAFNNIANVLPGIDKLPRVALPKGFADGGYTGPGGKYQPAGIVHAGEIVWSQADIARWGGVGIVEALRTAAGYAAGGLVNPLRNAIISQPFSGSHNGIDFAAATGTPVGAAGPGRVSSAGWSTGGGGNEIHIDHPNGLQTWYAHLSSFAVKLGEMVSAGQLIGQVGSTGNSTGPHLHYMVLNGGWPSYVNPAPYLDGGGEAGTGGGGWNPLAGIIDGLVGKFKEAFPAAGMIADLAIGVGKKLLTNVSDFIMGNGGKDKGTGSTGLPYLHDQGGVLNPGLSSIMNATRKPEAILTAQQWADMHRLATAGGGRGDVKFYGNVGWDPDEVANRIETKRRDTFAAFNI